MIVVLSDITANTGVKLNVAGSTRRPVTESALFGCSDTRIKSAVLGIIELEARITSSLIWSNTLTVDEV